MKVEFAPRYSASICLTGTGENKLNSPVPDESVLELARFYAGEKGEQGDPYSAGKEIDFLTHYRLTRDN